MSAPGITATRILYLEHPAGWQILADSNAVPEALIIMSPDGIIYYADRGEVGAWLSRGRATSQNRPLRRIRAPQRHERRKNMQLLTKEILDRLPPLYSQDGKGEDAVAQVKFFTPWSNWTWYASEYDPKERVFFGVVVGHERELGYFSLGELEAVRGVGGLKIERDRHWTPRPLRECK